MTKTLEFKGHINRLYPQRIVKSSQRADKIMPVGEGEMAQGVNALATQPDNLSVIPESHMVEGEN